MMIGFVSRCCNTCQSRDLALQPFPWNLTRIMVVCPECGSKRCGKAEWHDNPCETLKWHS